MNIDNEKICECNLLKKDQEGFKDGDDFSAFKNQIESNLLFKKLPEEKSLHTDHSVEYENWFQCSKCGAKWCLVEPDIPYYMGNWIKVTWRQ